MAPCAMNDEMDGQMPEVGNFKSSTIIASVLHGPRDMRIETRTITDPLPNELQITIKSTGICGSDVSYYKKFANGDLCACAPLSLGHESSGIVVAIGRDVHIFTLGDRVALEVGVPCGQCGICRKGRYNLCRKMRFRSSAKSVPHFQGTLQERINHPAVWCHKLPPNISLTTASLLEPLSVALHALVRASPSPGSTALVLGAGTVGLLTAAVALQSGCTTVTIADISAPRVEFALKHGYATHGFVVPQPDLRSVGSEGSISDMSSASSSAGACTPRSDFNATATKLDAARALASAILAATPPTAPADEDAGFTLSFDCTGAESCVQTCIYATAPGGKVVLVGMGTPVQTLPMSAAQLREVDIVGVFRYANTYARGLGMLSRMGERGGLPDLEALVTHRVKGLEGAGRALELAGKGMDEEGGLVLKVVVEY